MKQIYNIMVGMALMLGATSCEKEILDNGQAAGIALADGQFIVDYSGEVTTRAIKDNAAKGERINSLTYLLYMQQADDYVLQKRREIPGLNKTDDAGNPVYESWPLTRDNMTWEQREALKDTLMVGSNYRAVFVANADASLWGSTNSPLVGADLPTNGSAAPSYSSAYLQLPANLAFNDGNMFYLAEAEIDGTGQDRNTPYNCPIMLKRVVTRTDWWFERLPEVEFPSLETVVTQILLDEYPLLSTGESLDNNLKGYLYSYILSMVYAEMDGDLQNNIVAKTQEVLASVKTYYEGLSSAENTSEEDKEKYNAYATAMGDLSDAINGGSRETFWASITNATITPSEPESTPVLALETDLQNVLMTLAAYNLDLQALWKESQAEIESATVTYSSNTLGDEYYFNKSTTIESNEVTTPSIPFDDEETILPYEYRGFNWVGFAKAEGNKATTITLTKADGSTKEYNVGSNATQTGQGMNEWYYVTYRPIAGIAKGIETMERKIVVDLDAALPFASLGKTDEEIEDLKTAMQTALGDGVDIANYTLTISIPDLSKEMVITDSWSNPTPQN